MPSKDAIDAGLMRRLSGALKHWEKRKVPASIYKELLLPERRRAPDLSWESQAATARKIAEPALRALTRPLVSDYFAEGQSVLEVGAGSLVNGRSYVSRYFEHIPGLTWTASDVGQVDLTASGATPGALHDRAVASNVFDTIPYVDFTAALATIKKLVKPAGLFLHVADLNFYVNAFLDACGAPGTVLFPTPEPHKALHALPASVYRERLEAVKETFTADERKFLSAWGKHDPQVQAVVIGDAFLTKVDMSSLSKRIESVFEGHLQLLKQIGVFQRNLVAAAARSGWSVLECGFRVAEVTIPRRADSDATFNRYELDEGAVLGSVDPSVPAGMEKIRAKAHVFLARSV